MDEAAYEALAFPELKRLVNALDGVEDDRLECELSGDILSLCFDDDVEYVINSHRAARQIWMAAERTAWHFDWTGEAWVAAKTGDELWSTVERVLKNKLGGSVTLARD
ncbi:MAG: iron donor protein CyaY [Polyangiaceae bacterium]